MRNLPERVAIRFGHAIPSHRSVRSPACLRQRGPRRPQSVDQGIGLDTADFHEAAWAGAQFGGKQHGIPIQPHPEILAYRKDLFAEAGLQPPETTDDVLAAAKKLHNSKPGLAGLAWNAARNPRVRFGDGRASQSAAMRCARFSGVALVHYPNFYLAFDP